MSTAERKKDPTEHNYHCLINCSMLQMCMFPYKIGTCARALMLNCSIHIHYLSHLGELLPKLTNSLILFSQNSTHLVI